MTAATCLLILCRESFHLFGGARMSFTGDVSGPLILIREPTCYSLR